MSKLLNINKTIVHVKAPDWCSLLITTKNDFAKAEESSRIIDLLLSFCHLSICNRNIMGFVNNIANGELHKSYWKTNKRTSEQAKSLFIKRLEGLKKAEGIQIYVLFSISLNRTKYKHTLISVALMACGETGLACSNMLCLIVLT